MSLDCSRRRILRGLGVAGITWLGGCLGGETTAAEPPSHDIAVQMTPKRAFNPARATVKIGDTVAWHNNTGPPQSVTAYEDDIPSLRAYFASGGFEREITARILYPLQGAIRLGEWYAHTFDTPGEYRYFSIPSENEGMTGTVVVES